ncbi:MAG: ATP-grasp domain-containing protein [Patescibacteria group bacterium]
MENEKKNIGVIFGGMSAECEVSLATGRYVYSLLNNKKFTGTPFYLDKKGTLWQVPDKLVIQNTTTDIEQRLEKDASRVNFEDLPGKVSCVFNALLGKYGEDGCFQAILELLKIPYTGSGILASALGMDKKVHKKMLSGAGFLVAKDLLIRNSEFDIRKVTEKVSREIGFPCVVKPTREGSSMGVSVVKEEKGLETAFEYAFKYDQEVLVEEYLKGMEFTCVVWGNDDPKAMLPTEVVFEGDFFTYEGKYMPGKTQTITPARLSEEGLAEIQRQSVAIYQLIGCQGYGRVDGFVVPKTLKVGEPRPLGSLSLSDISIYIAEPHTGTIMVPSSFVFQQAAKFRIDLSTEFHGKKGSIPMTPRILVTKIIELAFEAFSNKKGLL